MNPNFGKSHVRFRPLEVWHSEKLLDQLLMLRVGVLRFRDLGF